MFNNRQMKVFTIRSDKDIKLNLIEIHPDLFRLSPANDHPHINPNYYSEFYLFLNHRSK